MFSMRFFTAVLAAFVAMFVVNAAAAVAVIDPLFGDRYPELTGDGADLDFGLLAAGYLLIAVVIAVLYRHDPARPRWLPGGLRVGIAVAATSFLAVHTVQAGYTQTDNTAWVLSGLLDMAGPIVAGLVAGYVTDRGSADRAAIESPAEQLGEALTRLDDPEASDRRLARYIVELEAVSGVVGSHLDRLRGTDARGPG